MPDDYKISDLTTAGAITNNDLMEISTVNSSSETGYSSVKATMTQIANKIANGVQYSADLETTAKTLVGAINEVNAGGGASFLDDLDDVNISLPQDKQVLLYDDANDEWVNGDNVAESLAESVKTTDQTPYQFRQTPITANRTLEKLIGVSCAFNQLVQNSGISFTSTNSDTRDIFALRIREISAPYIFFFLENLTAPKHIQTIINATASFTGLMLYHDGSQSNIVGYSDNDFNVISGHKYLLNIDVTGADVQTVGGVSYDDFNIIDLTACFGSEVADYLYTLESGTAGSGIALFKQLFPEDYYAYQTAHLESSKPVSKVVVGVNLFGGEYNIAYKLHIPANTQFTISCNKIGVDVPRFEALDASQTQIDYWAINSVNDDGRNFRTFTLAYDVYYVKVFYSNSDSIQLNFGADIPYHAYEKHTYPLGGDELRGLLKVENGQLVAYGDIHPSDGNGTEVFYQYDLGDVNWTRELTNGEYRFRPSMYAKLPYVIESGYEDNFICAEYVNDHAPASNNDKNKVMCIYAGMPIVRDDSYTTAEDFKTAMSGKYLIYEKATPTAKSYTPFTNPMLCGSTEEFTDSRSLKMFCGHQSQYYTETEGDKLANLPEVTGEQGKFIIENKDGKMSLSPIKEITGTLTAGNTSITLSDASITTESTIDVYTDTFGINPTAVSVSAGAVTLTFTAQSSNVKVKVRIT